MMGLWDAFQIIICNLYNFGLMLFETLLSYNGQWAIICYSFLCFAKGVGILIWFKKPYWSPQSVRLQQLAKHYPTGMKELAGPDGKYKDTIQKLPLLFDAIQWQQCNVGQVPHSKKDAGRYQSECSKVLWMIKGHHYTSVTQYGHPKLLKLRNPQLVLPAELYKAHHIHKPSPAQSLSYSQMARLSPGWLPGFRSAFQ